MPSDTADSYVSYRADSLSHDKESYLFHIVYFYLSLLLHDPGQLAGSASSILAMSSTNPLLLPTSMFHQPASSSGIPLKTAALCS
jgi:hypothetical protein